MCLNAVDELSPIEIPTDALDEVGLILVTWSFDVLDCVLQSVIPLPLTHNVLLVGL